jgi:hypothetical protein
VKKWLDKLDAGIKSRTINQLLRAGFQKVDESETVEKRMAALETKIQIVEKQMRTDGFTLAAIRRVLLNRFGERAAAELEKEFNDIYFGSTPVPAPRTKEETTPPPAVTQTVEKQIEDKPRKAEPKPDTEMSWEWIAKKFTEKAVKVIQLAQEEARRAGHNFVGTEQLMLGLIGEGTSIAAKALKSSGVNLKDARTEVSKIIGRGSGFISAQIPFTPRSKRVMGFAVTKAQECGQKRIGPEHILLGLLREGEGVGVRALENLGVNLQKLSDAMLHEIDRDD